MSPTSANRASANRAAQDPGWRICGIAPGDPAQAWAHHGVERVARACAVECDGHDDEAMRAGDSAVDLARQEDEERTLLVAVAGGAAGTGAAAGTSGTVAGWTRVDRSVTANQHAAWLHILVHPAQRGRGLGAALLDRAEQIAADDGRSTFQVEAPFGAAAQGPRLPVTTGAGATSTGATSTGATSTGATSTGKPSTGTVPAQAPGVRFALAHGYELVQAERRSTLTTPVAPHHLDALAAEAAASATGYRLHTWHGAVPDPWLDAFALLETRMSTDAPLGGLDAHEDPWDAGRVRRMCRDLAEMGRDCAVTAAEHTATGELAAMTMLTWDRTPEEFAFQWDTIVLRGHRGHRLGMLIKCANLRCLARLRPGIHRVHTRNAAENDHMLAINVALGFRPAGGTAVLQKRT